MTFRATTNRDPRAELRVLSCVLRDAHRSLIEFSRDRYVLATGLVSTRSELLGLMVGHDAFTWLRPLTKLITEIDALAARVDPPSGAEIAEIGGRAAALTSGSDDPEAFGSRYVALLPAEPRIAMHHGDLRAAVAALLEPVTGAAA